MRCYQNIKYVIFLHCRRNLGKHSYFIQRIQTSGTDGLFKDDSESHSYVGSESKNSLSNSAGFLLNNFELIPENQNWKIFFSLMTDL